MKNKGLHKHSMPLVMLSIGFLIVSALAISQLLVTVPVAKGNISELLGEHLFSIAPAKNGLFQIKRYQATDQTSSNLLTHQSASTGLAEVNSTGEITVLNTTLNSLGQTTQ